MKVLACIVLALVAVASATEPEKRAVFTAYGAYPYAAGVYPAGYVAPSAYVAPAVASVPVVTKTGTPASTVGVSNVAVPLAYNYGAYPYAHYGYY